MIRCAPPPVVLSSSCSFHPSASQFVDQTWRINFEYAHHLPMNIIILLQARRFNFPPLLYTTRSEWIQLFKIDSVRICWMVFHAESVDHQQHHRHSICDKWKPARRTQNIHLQLAYWRILFSSRMETSRVVRDGFFLGARLGLLIGIYLPWFSL